MKCQKCGQETPKNLTGLCNDCYIKLQQKKENN